jgi:hypothetical protein
MPHQIFSFPLFAIVQQSGDSWGPAILEVAEGALLMLFTSLEKAEEFRTENPLTEIFKINDEAEAMNALGQLSGIAGVILNANATVGRAETSPSEDISQVKARLLSSEGVRRRVEFLDNIKSLSLSSADIEALIAGTSSGKANSVSGFVISLQDFIKELGPQSPELN